MGQVIFVVAILALVLLLIPNFSPYKWAKCTASGLVAVPILFVVLSPMVSKLKRNIGYMVDATKPIFWDKERDQIARAVRDEDPEKLKKLLKLPVLKLNLDGELLAFAISETSVTAYRPEGKLDYI